jgi:hypothetical protein
MSLQDEAPDGGTDAVDDQAWIVDTSGSESSQADSFGLRRARTGSADGMSRGAVVGIGVPAPRIHLPRADSARL